MKTPIADFVREYSRKGLSRFHMPGHKGQSVLGCESLDITEVHGADSLYEAAGIIRESEANATALFGSGGSFFSTEGSSQCIRAMLYLALLNNNQGSRRVLAARNVHKAFVYGAALLDLEVSWLWPEGDNSSLCHCLITPSYLESRLRCLEQPPIAVYLTSPDYLGGQMDIAALARVCHKYNTLLLVDNAHGAYLRFLPRSAHPLDLGADLCCDSAHKTLPVLTGGAYLHLSKNLPAGFRENAKTALSLFGSTSPSYLIMASLDLCNRYLADDYPRRLTEMVNMLEDLGNSCRRSGWQVEPSDPLRLTIRATVDRSGLELADWLRRGGVECEYWDPEYVVFMATPENTEEDIQRLKAALGDNTAPVAQVSLPVISPEQALSLREAIFSPQEVVPISRALGRICGAPTVSCPPAIPILVSGEQVNEAALEIFAHYGISELAVVK